jgi:tetratricopeptide (TPR) repeat protein
MICRLVLVTLTILACAGGQAAAAERDSDPLGAWIGQLRNCIGSKDTLHITVIGFKEDQTAVSPEEAAEIRLAVASRLLKEEGLTLTPARDVTLLNATHEGTTGLPTAKGEAQIQAAFDGDAMIYFVSPHRQTTSRVQFRLQAITRAANCAAISDPIDLALSATQGLADAGQVMANAVKHLVEAEPNVRFVDVLPFSAITGHSICSAALTDALMVALLAEARDRKRMLNDKTLAVTKVMAPGLAEAGRVSAHGTFELERDNRAFIRLEFEGDGGRTIALTGRVAIATDRLACDPTEEGRAQLGEALRREQEALPEGGRDVYRKGDDDLAIRTHSKSIDREWYVRAYIARGEAYRRKRMLEEALRDFDKAIELDDNNADAFYDRGFIYTLREDHVSAIKDYDAAIRLNSSDASSLNNRCWSRAIIGHLRLAMEDCNAALRLRPNFADARDSRGFTYLKLGQFDLAIADYNAALSVVPHRADSLYGRGLARRKLGQAAAGNTDIADARAIRADIGEVFARRGVQ